MTEHLDVLIVGAGLSGIDAAYRIQSECPDKKYALLEARDSIGGTWDLFKYPGIRSDSDMYTLGFPFYPWKNPKAIADGPSILSYIKETAKHFGIDKHIRFQHKVVQANWSSREGIWTIDIQNPSDETTSQLTCNFLFMTSGYYNYSQGHSPIFENKEEFNGKIIHPQHWDTNLDYSNKKIVVIGSGATAVTLVPSLAKKASQVTMLQRSPTYMMRLPSEDVIANSLNKFLPSKLAYNIIKWKNIFLGLSLYNISRKWPAFTKRQIEKGILLGIKDKTQLKHFQPSYNPWDQRLCLVPDGDFFKAIKSKKASIVTDTIKRFTKNGILLDSGEQLRADIIITATGLQLQLLGGMKVFVDGKEVDFGKTYCFKGVMFNDVPNLAFAIGYTNASWTLKSDLNCQFVTRLLNYMDQQNKKKVVPKFDASKFDTEPLLDFDANYVKRAEKFLPKQGSKKPWKVHQNYIKDTIALKYESVNNKYLEFS